MKDLCLPIHQNGELCYNIIYSSDPNALQNELKQTRLAERKALIVTDSHVGPLYAKAIQDVIPGDPLIYTLPAGEENKTLDEIRHLLTFLVEHHYDRKSYLVALGGGVVGDMTGFASAIYMRGIDFIQIPTTLLAQADSSIGGKTGVDFDGYKNMVGAFKMPRLVAANVEFLKTLDERQYSSGFAEIMKSALIRDVAFYEWLLEHHESILKKDPDVLSEMIYRSDKIKRDVVEKDPYEKGERMLLNFGHTLGHAIEKYSRFTMTHGECVALGCVAASYLSWQKGYLSKESYEKIRSGFPLFGLSNTIPSVDEKMILQLTKSDKKAVNGKVKFVLLHEIGNAFIEPSVSDEEILSAVRVLVQG